MTTLNQWLERKKKSNPLMYKTSEENYNQALSDLQAFLPTLLSTMEAEIRERIGENEEKPLVLPPESDAYMYSLAQFNKVAGINAERSRIHTIIHEYFKTQE